MMLFVTKKSLIKKLRKCGYLFLDETDELLRFTNNKYKRTDSEVILCLDKRNICFYYQVSGINYPVGFSLDEIEIIYNLLKILESELREQLREEKREAKLEREKAKVD